MIVNWFGSKTCSVLLVVGVVLTASLLAGRVTDFPLPGNNIGYEPPQPIEFSHRLHAGEMGISCYYCHDGAEKSRHAGIPAVNRCMNCHKNVRNTALQVQHARDNEKEITTSPEILKIYRAMGLGEDGKPDDATAPDPIEWVQIHRLPDFAYFDHRRHVYAGVSCQSCHGQVENMERVRQTETLSMGWCMECHREMDGAAHQGRELHPTLNCASCHY